MTVLEIKLIVYGLLFLALVGGVSWVTYTLTSHHYERLEAADKLAQDQALAQAQNQVIAAQKAQQAAAQSAEKQYADLKSHDDTLARALSGSVSNYAALSRGVVSTSATTAAFADAARAGAERDRELTVLVQQAIGACLGDAAELTALQTWAQGTSK